MSFGIRSGTRFIAAGESVCSHRAVPPSRVHFCHGSPWDHNPPGHGSGSLLLLTLKMSSTYFLPTSCLRSIGLVHHRVSSFPRLGVMRTSSLLEISAGSKLANPVSQCLSQLQQSRIMTPEPERPCVWPPHRVPGPSHLPTHPCTGVPKRPHGVQYVCLECVMNTRGNLSTACERNAMKPFKGGPVSGPLCSHPRLV